MTESPRPSDLVKDTFPDAAPAPSADVANIEDLEEAMRDVVDPELMVNVVDLGLVYGINVDEENNATIDMTLTAPGCGMGEVLVADVREKVEIIPTVKRADVELVFDPPWNQSMMSDAARLQTGMM